jgi:hypothetical protein
MAKIGTLDREDYKKIVKGAVFAMGGAFCAYGLTVLEVIEIEQNYVFFAAMISILLNAGVKFFQDK